MTPPGKHCIFVFSSQQLPSLLLGPLKGVLTWRPSRTLDSPRTLLRELQRNKNTAGGCQARHGGPKTPSITNFANLDCVFIENALLLVVPKIERPHAPLGLPFTPPLVNSPSIYRSIAVGLLGRALKYSGFIYDCIRLL